VNDPTGSDLRSENQGGQEGKVGQGVQGGHAGQGVQGGQGGQAEAEDRLLHGSSFGAAAAAYAEHRPDYAEAAVRWALQPARDRRPVRVVDIGAGTGKLTATLVRLGADVTAVEPDPQMLAELRRAMPAARSVPGSAEQIPLPDASVDAVLAGQAMHWFDLDRAMPEIARVLTPGGVFAGLWNVDDDRVGWVAELAEISKRKSSVTLMRWRDGAARSRRDRLIEAGSGLFHASQEGEFGHGQARTADSLLATIATHSHLLVMDEAERAGLLARVRDFLYTRPETSNGEFTLPLVTVVLRVLRR
jgi:SAM-dependent methyltransferase